MEEGRGRVKQTYDYDVNSLIPPIENGFKSYLKAIGCLPNDIDFRHFFDQDHIAELPNNPIVTHRIVRTTPAALKGRPFSAERDYGSRDNYVENTPEGFQVEVSRQYYETLVSFGFFSDTYSVVTELSQEFRNYISLFRNTLRQAIQLPDIFFWQRKADEIIYVKGTLLYTCEVQVYLKTLSLLMIDTALIKEIIIDVTYESKTI